MFKSQGGLKSSYKAILFASTAILFSACTTTNETPTPDYRNFKEQPYPSVYNSQLAFDKKVKSEIESVKHYKKGIAVKMDGADCKKTTKSKKPKTKKRKTSTTKKYKVKQSSKSGKTKAHRYY